MGKTGKPKPSKMMLSAQALARWILVPCLTCGGLGWQWQMRRNGEGSWGHCPRCHGFGLDLETLAERLDLDRKPKPKEPLT